MDSRKRGHPPGGNGTAISVQRLAMARSGAEAEMPFMLPPAFMLPGSVVVIQLMNIWFFQKSGE
jgi:hypothetical protein